MPLDPLIVTTEQAALRLMSEPTADIAGQRAQALRIDREVVAPLVATAPEVEIRDVAVPVLGHGTVPVRLFVPPGGRPDGMYLFFFGGAFRQGAVDFPSVDALLRARAVGANTVIAAPSYALAPEFRFPVPVEQGMAVLRWLATESAFWGLAPTDITIGGMSAGGNIAAAVALVNRDSDAVPIRQQLLEVPVTDLTGDHLSAEVGPLLGIPEELVRAWMQPIAELYLDDADPRTPTASPLLAPDLSGLPEAHVFTAGHDVLLGDGRSFVAALNGAGTRATEHHFSGMTHGSLSLTRDLAEAQDWQAAVIEVLQP